MAPIEMPATQLGMYPAMARRLVSAGLIGAKRAAALQDEHGLFGGIGHIRNLALAGRGVESHATSCVRPRLPIEESAYRRDHGGRLLLHKPMT